MLRLTNITIYLSRAIDNHPIESDREQCTRSAYFGSCSSYQYIGHIMICGSSSEGRSQHPALARAQLLFSPWSGSDVYREAPVQEMGGDRWEQEKKSILTLEDGRLPRAATIRQVQKDRVMQCCCQGGGGSDPINLLVERERCFGMDEPGLLTSITVCYYTSNLDEDWDQAGPVSTGYGPLGGKWRYESNRARLLLRWVGEVRERSTDALTEGVTLEAWIPSTEFWVTSGHPRE